MKKWIVVTVIAAIILGGSGGGYYFYDKHTKSIAAQARANYISTLQDAFLEMSKGSIQAQIMCAGFSDVWSRAINNGSVKIGDNYAFNFNDAIGYQEQSYEQSGGIKDLNSGKSKVDSLMKQVNNPPSDLKNAYSTLMQLYDDYSQLISEAESPSGSLMTYNQTTDQLQMDYKKKMDEFNVEMPQQ